MQATHDSETVVSVMPLASIPPLVADSFDCPIPTPEDLAVIQAIYRRYPFLFRNTDARDGRAVSDVIQHYLKSGCHHLNGDTLKSRKYHLGLFEAAYGHCLLSEIGPLAVQEFLAQHESWVSPWTQAQVVGDIQAVFNWSMKVRFTRENPFKGYSVAGEKVPGRNLTLAEFQAAMRHSPAYFRRFLMMMKVSGARPGELRTLR